MVTTDLLYERLHENSGKMLRNKGIVFQEYPHINLPIDGKSIKLRFDFLLPKHLSIISCRPLEHRLCAEFSAEFRSLYQKKLVELRENIMNNGYSFAIIDPYREYNMTKLWPFTFTSIEDFIYTNLML
ncbi:MAG: hypothetical protein R3F48_13555 [Candidatus Zixiibacteriota bacterium]